MDDHISILPDEILCHILSFLPTKHAASTSVLSTRWRDLIASVPTLEFDDSVFLHPDEMHNQERYVVRQSFMAFVDRVLALQGDSRIRKFSLKCETASRDRMDRWICNVLQRGVSDFEIFIEDDDYSRPPLELPTLVSRTLKKLELSKARLPGGVFRWLQFLYFNSYGYKEMPVFLRKCPHLDTLVQEGITEYCTDKCDDACDCISQEDESRLLISCRRLRKIQLKGCRGTNAEMGVLVHYLKYFPSLQKMEIYAGEKCPTDVFEQIVKKVNLYYSFQVVVFTSWCVIYPIGRK